MTSRNREHDPDHPWPLCDHGDILRELRAIRGQLNRIEKKEKTIMASQDDINAATAQIDTEVADLGTQDAAILAAQNALVTVITGLQNSGVDTSALVTATAALLTAQGADDATVTALTDAATAA